MDDILLSIIITTHGKKYDILKYHTLDDYSIFSHINEPIEIIITEDLLTEQEPEYVSQLRERGLNIKYVYSPNMGAACNRTNGLMNSKGKYITFVDSPDDLIFEFEKIKDILLSDYNIVYFCNDCDGKQWNYEKNCCNWFSCVIWGKFFKSDWLKKYGGLYYVFDGYWEEVPGTCILSAINHDNLKFTRLNSDLIQYLWWDDGEHTSNIVVSKEKILKALQNGKRNFNHPERKILYKTLLSVLREPCEKNNYPDLIDFIQKELDNLDV